MTILSHIYNEEFLLPWWLKHHRNFFDHGIIIDYASTDRSLDIVRELCPTWEIHQSVNSHFDAWLVDKEVEQYERRVVGPRIALNTTEFLYGPYDEITSEDQIYIPAYYFVDPLDLNESVNLEQPLHDQFKLAVPWQHDIWVRRTRLLHSNPSINYPLGRHFEQVTEEKNFVIFCYGQAPMTEKFIERKLQIQHRIPHHNKMLAQGHTHYLPGGGLLDRATLIQRKNTLFLPFAKDLSPEIQAAVDLCYRKSDLSTN